MNKSLEQTEKAKEKNGRLKIGIKTKKEVSVYQ